MTEERGPSGHRGEDAWALGSRDLSKVDAAELQALRRRLLDEVGAARRADPGPPEEGDEGDEPGEGRARVAGSRADADFSAIRAIESQLFLVDDEIWRRDDARVDAASLALYSARRATWCWVDQAWPLARPAWEREAGSAGDGGLSLLVWVGPPRQ